MNVHRRSRQACKTVEVDHRAVASGCVFRNCIKSASERECYEISLLQSKQTTLVASFDLRLQEFIALQLQVSRYSHLQLYSGSF